MSVTSVSEPEVIDNRRHNFTQIDNEVFDVYAQHIGPQGIALYCALVRFAYQDRATFPSHANLGKKSGMSARSVQKYLPFLTKDNPELAAHNLSPLVEIRHRKRPDGGDASNLYVLLPITKSAPPPRQTYSDPPTKAFADDEYVTDEETTTTGTSPVVEPPRTTRKATRIKDDFEPDESTMIWLATEGFRQPDLDRELPRFIDYYAGTGKTMVDWQRTFKNWLRKSQEYGRTNGNGKPKPQYYEKDGSYTVEGALARQRGEI